MDGRETRTGRRRRRWIAVSVVVLLVVGGVWQVAERYIGAERFRPVLEEALSDLFGLPAQIEGLDIYWWPQPHLAGFGVTLGEGEFRISAQEVAAEASLRSLWRGVLRLQRISSDSLRIDLPAEDATLSKDLNHVITHLFGPGEDPEGSGESAIQISAIELNEVAIFRGGVEAARVNVEILDVLGSVAQVMAKAVAPYLGPESALSAALSIDSSGDGAAGISGTIETVAFPLAFFVDVPLISSYSLTGTGAVSGQAPGNLQLAAEGQAISEAHPALNGAFTGNLWYRNGQIDINDLRLSGEEVQAVVDLSLPQAGGFACRVQRGALDRAALATVAAAVLPAETVSFSPESGRMTVLNLLFGQEGEAPIRFSEGEASFLRLGVEGGAGGWLPDLNARVRVNENSLIVEDLSNEYVQLSGSLAPDFASGTTGVSLSGTADLSADLLRLFVADDRIESATGRVRFETIEGQLGGASPGLTVAARLEEAGVQVRQAEGPPLAVDTIHGGVRYEGGVLTLDGIEGAGFSVSGTLAPEGDGWAFDLQGAGSLDNPLIALVLPEAVKSASGQVDLKTLRGSWSPGLALPAAFAVEGGIQEGRLEVATEAYTGKISELHGTFSTDAEALVTELRMQAEGPGPARISGRYAYGDQRWEGDVDLNLAALAGLFITERSAERWMDALLASQRDAKLAVTVELPAAPGEPVQVALAPRSGSGLEGTIVVAPSDTGWALGKVEVRGPVSAAAIAPLISESLRGEGTLYARVETDPAAKRFSARADLKQASIAYGTAVRKPAGVEGEVSVSGVSAPQWSITDCQVQILGQSLWLRPKGAGMASEPFSLDLASLSPLVPDGAGAKGTISGSFTTAPLSLDLQLAAATLPLAGGAGQVQADGGIRYQSGLWNFDSLRLQGPRTNCLVTASAEGGGWRGELSGSSLDLDVALLLAGLGASGGGTSGGGGQGVLAVDLGTLHVGRGALTAVQGQLQTGGGAVRFTDARAILGAGTASGTVTWTGGGAGELAVQLNLDRADLSVIEALLLAEKRGMSGGVSGVVDLRFPAGGGKAALQGLSGTGDLKAENGSYGQTTLATRLLNLARTVEVIYLRLPSLGETGLTFDTSLLRFQAESGRVQVTEFTLGTRSYGFQAAGVVDFARDTTEVTGKIYAFESVTGILGSVPVLGSTVDRFRKLIALPVRISGSAFAPEVGRGSDEAGVEMVPE